MEERSYEWIEVFVMNICLQYFFKYSFHNTCHFNLRVCFQNWSLQLTLKITWSLAKIKVAIVFFFKILKLSWPFHFSCFYLLTSQFLDIPCFWLIQTEMILMWKVLLRLDISQWSLVSMKNTNWWLFLAYFVLSYYVKDLLPKLLVWLIVRERWR